MKPIGNIFGFDCVTCEHNRNCYGGNMGNQFRYCQKSIEKVQNLDKLEQENKQLKEVIDKAIEYINNLECLHIGIGENEYNLDKMYGSTKNYVRDLLEILKGSDSNE